MRYGRTRRTYRSRRSSYARRTYRRTYKRYGGRKVYRQRRNRGHIRTGARRINRPVVPRAAYVKLKFFDTVYQGQFTDSTPKTVSYRGNTIFDPEAGSDSRNAIGVSAWGRFFSYYQVTACKISVAVRTYEENRDLRVTIFPTTYNPPVYMTNPAITPIVGMKTKLIWGTGGGGHNIIKGYMTTAGAYGTSLTALGSKETSAGWSSTPTKEWFWNIQSENALSSPDDQSQTIPALSYYVKLTYWVKLFNQSPDAIRPTLEEDGLAE